MEKLPAETTKKNGRITTIYEAETEAVAEEALLTKGVNHQSNCCNNNSKINDTEVQNNFFLKE